MNWFWWVLVALVPVVALVGFTTLLFCEWVARGRGGRIRGRRNMSTTWL